MSLTKASPPGPYFLPICRLKWALASLQHFTFYSLMGKVNEISDANFRNELTGSTVPVVIDFWAPWCAPCRAIAPIVEELAGELGGKVKILKMNVDENPQVPGQLGIRSIPTLKIFKNGQEVDQMVGSGSKDQIKAFITAHC